MVTEEQVRTLRKELAEVRECSLAATRAGDFMKVAMLTAQAARLNKAIMDGEAEIEARRIGENPKYAAKRR